MDAQEIDKADVFTSDYGAAGENAFKKAFPVPANLSLLSLMRDGGFDVERTVLARQQIGYDTRFWVVVRQSSDPPFDRADARVALESLDYFRRGDDAWDVYDRKGRVAAIRAKLDDQFQPTGPWYVRREHEGSILFPFDTARAFASHLEAFAYVCRSLLA